MPTLLWFDKPMFQKFYHHLGKNNGFYISELHIANDRLSYKSSARIIIIVPIVALSFDTKLFIERSNERKRRFLIRKKNYSNHNILGH